VMKKIVENVVTNVKLVLVLKRTVLYAQKTESRHHHVIVQQAIITSKTKLNVQNVMKNVTLVLVMLITVKFVLKDYKIHQNVHLSLLELNQSKLKKYQ